METGINSSNLDLLINELHNKNGILLKNFNDIDQLIESCNFFFKGEVATSFFNKYSEIKDNFPILIRNIEKYPKELLLIRNNYIEHDISTARSLDGKNINIVDSIKPSDNCGVINNSGKEE